jgi:pyruvate,water dikinase
MSSKIWVCDDEPSARYPVWTRGNVAEAYSEVLSPLAWSLYGRQVWEPMWRDVLYAIGVFAPEEFKPVGQPEVVGCFGGYCYINLSVNRVMAVRMPGLTVEAMDKSFFGDSVQAPPYRPDPRDANAQRTAAVSAWLEAVLTDDPKPLIDLAQQCVDAMVAHRPHLASLSDAGLLAHFRALTAEARLTGTQHLPVLLGSNVLASLVAQTCQAVGASALTANVIAGIGGIDSAAQSFDLWDLSRAVRSSPVVAAAFDAGAEGALDRLRASGDSAARHFVQGWDAFIRRWGYFGPNVWEFRSPTYRTCPELVLRMLERARHAPDATSPHARAATLAAEREAAIADIAARLGGDTRAQGQFVAAARAAAKYLSERERSKMLCALVLDECRTAIRELGQRLVGQGHLAQWEHVLLVLNEEVDAFLAEPARFRETIAERAARLTLLQAKEPPFVFEGEPLPLSAFKDRVLAPAEGAAAGTRLSGLAVSPGRYTGRARLIRSLRADIELEPGEVIVAATTDASWGPLFLTAGAAVVETGAVTSHAAIVARELGIPAVVSVPDATRRIRDGAVLTVDGSTGTVTVQ